jgi:hypothetical protein
MVADSNPFSLVAGGMCFAVAARRWGWIRSSIQVHRAITTGERFHSVDLCRARVNLNKVLHDPILIGPNANVFGEKTCDGTINVHVISNKPRRQLEEENAMDAVEYLTEFVAFTTFGFHLTMAGIVGF